MTQSQTSTHCSISISRRPTLKVILVRNSGKTVKGWGLHHLKQQLADSESRNHLLWCLETSEQLHNPSTEILVRSQLQWARHIARVEDSRICSLLGTPSSQRELCKDTWKSLLKACQLNVNNLEGKRLEPLRCSLQGEVQRQHGGEASELRKSSVPFKKYN